MVEDQETFMNHVQEEGWAYAMYATLDPENEDTGYSLSDVRLCAVETPGIPREYADLEEVGSKEAAQTLP